MMEDKIGTATFPKQYHKRYFDDIDKTFLIVLFLSFIAHFGTVGYFVLNPLPTKIPQHSIKKIQDQFASLVLDREEEATKLADALAAGPKAGAPEPPAPVATSGLVGSQESAPSSQAAGPSTVSPASEPGAGTAEAALSSRAQRQKRIESQVATQGILGALTGSGPTMNNQALQDVLGSGGSANSDFDQVFNNLDKLSTSGGKLKGRGQTDSEGIRSQSAARGKRTTQGGTIKTSVSKIGEVQGTAPTRTTEFVVAELTPLSGDGTEQGGGGGGGAGAQGARDANAVRSVVEAHSPAIEYCYNRELKRNPDLKGKIVVKFTITPAGKVINPKIILSTLNSESVERCILSRISRWDDFGKIDPSLGNATYRQVYTFGF